MNGMADILRSFSRSGQGMQQQQVNPAMGNALRGLQEGQQGQGFGMGQQLPGTAQQAPQGQVAAPPQQAPRPSVGPMQGAAQGALSGAMMGGLPGAALGGIVGLAQTGGLDGIGDKLKNIFKIF